MLKHIGIILAASVDLGFSFGVSANEGWATRATMTMHMILMQLFMSAFQIK